MGPQVGPLWPFGSLWLSPWPPCNPKTSSWPLDPLDPLGPLKRPQGPRRPRGVPLVSHDDPFDPLGPLKRLPWPNVSHCPKYVPLDPFGHLEVSLYPLGPLTRPTWSPRTTQTSSLTQLDHLDDTLFWKHIILICLRKLDRRRSYILVAPILFLRNVPTSWICISNLRAGNFSLYELPCWQPPCFQDSAKKQT